MHREPAGPVIGRPRRHPGPFRTLALAIGLVALFAQSAPAPARAAQTWTVNLFTSRAFLYQDPYGTACTAASTMIMLNTIAYRHAGGTGFRWTPSRVKNDAANRSNTRDMTSILWFERAHDTLSAFGSGSDGHGWRNALNAYGWGGAAMTDPALGVYDDLEYASYDTAVHAAIRAIAEFGMPVGIISWAGRHAQVMTGYVVDGADPAVSDAFTVRYVYLSDPLFSDHAANIRISNAAFKAGALHFRFQAYRETDSPYDDSYMPGWKRSSVSPSRGSSEWYHRWVILAPIRGFVPPVDPPPDPTPTPSPTAPPDPTPSLSPSAEPSAAPSSDASPSAAPASAPPESPSPDTTPSASPSTAA